MPSPPLLLLYILLVLTLSASVSVIFYGFRNGITPMPSSDSARRAMVEAVELVLAPGSSVSAKESPLIVEAGSGWGGPAIEIALRFPSARVTGYENSPLPLLFSQLRKRIVGNKRLSNLRFCRKDFRREGIYSADIVVCYLYPGGMKDIAALIEEGLHTAPPREPPWVISNTFSLPEYSPVAVFKEGEKSGAPVYIYCPHTVYRTA